MKHHLKNIAHKFCSRLFIRYLLGGVGGFAFTLITTYVFTELFQFNYYIIYVLTFTITTLLNFIIATRFVFQTNDHHHIRFIKYLFSTLLFYFLNIILVHVAVETFGLHYLLSISGVTGFIVITKFLIFDKYVFQKV